MKARKILSLALAAVMAAAAVVSVSAAELTESNSNGQTEVKAHIDGGVPGDVSYIITIPDTVDFETLAVPENNTDDHNKDVEYTVTMTKLEGLDPAEKVVNVYVKDQNAVVGSVEQFYIANKSNADVKFAYDVYTATGANVNMSTNVNFNTMETNGFFLTGFSEQGQSLTGTLRFDLNQLYGESLARIAGDYSGYMVFFSAIEDVQ